MKNKTVTHEISIEVGFSDIYTWIKDYCKEGQLMPDVPKIDKKLIKTGSNTEVGVNYCLNWKEDVSQDLRVEKSATIIFTPELVLLIIKDAVMKKLSLASDEDYEWLMLKKHWCWENGAQGMDTVFSCNLELSKIGST